MSESVHSERYVLPNAASYIVKAAKNREPIKFYVTCIAQAMNIVAESLEHQFPIVNVCL